MQPEKNRRYLERITIDGAKITYRMDRVSRYSGPVPLSDLTWSSLRFEADPSLQTGEIIELQIFIPGEDKIRVRGHLIWTSRSDETGRNFAVVQLLPFGPGREYNSMNTRDTLKRIINQFKAGSA